MENNNPSRLSAVWFALCAVLLSGSPCVAQLGVEGRDWDRDMDRPGMDYKRIDGQWNPDACHWACQWDPACKAWTSCLTSPQTGSCWLKHGVPPKVRKGMCFSGLRLPEEGTVKAPVGGVLGALKEASKCPKLTEFVTASPLPESGVGWDYKVQLQATGGAAPVKFLTPYFERATGVQTALSCSSGGSSPSGPAYYPGQMMVEGLTLNCDGRITGQPKAPGYFTVTIVATDSCALAQKIEKNFVLQVKGPS